MAATNRGVNIDPQNDGLITVGRKIADGGTVSGRWDLRLVEALNIAEIGGLEGNAHLLHFTAESLHQVVEFELVAIFIE